MLTSLVDQDQASPIDAPVEPQAVNAQPFDHESARLRRIEQANFRASKRTNRASHAHARLDDQTLAVFASTSHAMHSLFQPLLRERAAIQLVQFVGYGDEDNALARVQANPALLTKKVIESERKDVRTVKTYSGKILTGMTAYQAALCEGDKVMAEKLETIYLAAHPTDGQAEIEAQFHEIFPHGYAAHLEKQKREAEEFERKVIDPLVDIITNTTLAELQAALDKQDNDTALCQALKAFKAAFNELSHSEMVSNPHHLLKVLEKYHAKFDAWFVNFDNPNRWLRLDLFWRQVIGWEQRYMTANDAQSICTGLKDMLEEDKALERTFKLHSTNGTGYDPTVFPLDTDPVYALGNSAIYINPSSAYRTSGLCPGEVPFVACIYKTYVEQKQQAWEHYAARIESSRSARVSSSMR